MMQDGNRPRAQLLEELEQMRRQLAALQDRLEASERRAALFFETAPLGIHECDVEGRITLVNPTRERMTGYTAEEQLGAFIWDYLEPGPAKDALPAYLKHLGSEQPTPTPYFGSQVRKDGEVFQARVDWNYKRDGQGRVIGFVCMMADITEERKAHDALEEEVVKRTAELRKANEELAIFRRFAEASGQGFGMADMDGLITYMNPALCRIAGVERLEDAVGKHLTTYYPEGYQQRRETEIIPALLQEGYWEGELAHTLGGKLLTVLQHSFLIRDEHGNPSNLASVITDITGRKRAEAALRASEERFRSYFEQGLIGMAVSTLDQRWREVNDRLCEMFGYSREELLGMAWSEATHPDDVERSLVPFRRVVEGEIDHYTLEKRYIRKDGEVVHANIFVRCFRRQDGAVDHFVTLIEDMTERKRAEALLQEEYRTLQHLLRSSDHERQLIAYDIHDGLTQHLTGAIMQFQTFDEMRETMPKQAAEAYEAGMTMLRQSHYEARRLIAGVRPPILDELGIVSAISHLVHEQGHRRGPTIEFRSRVHFSRLVPTLENTLYRIAQEAVENACRYSNSAKVRVSLVQRDAQVRIKIQDWGIGFDAEAPGEDRFGLEGIRQRTRLWGGTCNIRSIPGEGTRVTVELPVVAREADE